MLLLSIFFHVMYQNTEIKQKKLENHPLLINYQVSITIIIIMTLKQFAIFKNNVQNLVRFDGVASAILKKGNGLVNVIYW